MPGSGKTIVSDKAKQLGIFTLTIDDIVREEMQKKGVIYTQDNEKKMRDWFYNNKRELMRRMTDKITQLNPNKIVIEGLKSPNQIQDLKNRLYGEELSILAVHSSPEVRLMRQKSLYERKGFILGEGDKTEIEMGTPELISMADHLIVNEGNLPEFRKTVKDKLIELLNIDVKG
ncbi:MAG: hypothetical protein AUJ50_04425 [Candidatus Aenigmarchaeota archaeon CG1_02_38_14]|nr:MAG: hypothetical protein AUJ50_04425 [Candidatus Aenigmarchaeota archaeon CG1_02_38_14]